MVCQYRAEPRVSTGREDHTTGTVLSIRSPTESRQPQDAYDATRTCSTAPVLEETWCYTS
eukprot:3638837-Rhodomonas_salina.1